MHACTRFGAWDAWMHADAGVYTPACNPVHAAVLLHACMWKTPIKVFSFLGARYDYSYYYYYCSRYYFYYYIYCYYYVFVVFIIIIIIIIMQYYYFIDL